MLMYNQRKMKPENREKGMDAIQWVAVMGFLVAFIFIGACMMNMMASNEKHPSDYQPMPMKHTNL